MYVRSSSVKNRARQARSPWIRPRGRVNGCSMAQTMAIVSGSGWSSQNRTAWRVTSSPLNYGRGRIIRRTRCNILRKSNTSDSRLARQKAPLAKRKFRGGVSSWPWDDFGVTLPPSPYHRLPSSLPSPFLARVAVGQVPVQVSSLRGPHSAWSRTCRNMEALHESSAGDVAYKCSRTGLSPLSFSLSLSLVPGRFRVPASYLPFRARRDRHLPLTREPPLPRASLYPRAPRRISVLLSPGSSRKGSTR